MKNIQFTISLIALLTVTTITAQDFVPVTYEVISPEKVTRTDGIKISVNFKTNGNWYIYAPTGQNEKQGMIETNLEFKLPEGITKNNMDLPPPRPYGMYQIYKGAVSLSQNFSIDKNLQPGLYDIECIVTYQTCNESICLPPDTKSYTKTIIIK